MPFRVSTYALPYIVAGLRVHVFVRVKALVNLFKPAQILNASQTRHQIHFRADVLVSRVVEVAAICAK